MSRGQISRVPRTVVRLVDGASRPDDGRLGVEEILLSGHELLNPMISSIGNKNHAFGGDGDLLRIVEHSTRLTSLAPLVEKLALGIKLLNSVVAGVHYQDVAVGIDGHIGGAVELTIFSSVRAER